MRRWERLEEYLFDHDQQGTEFTVHEYAEKVGLSVRDASRDIQAYLRAQRIPQREVVRPNGTVERVNPSQTLYVLRRTPGTRTRATRWAVGVKTKDALQIGDGFADDVHAKLMRAVKPDLMRIEALNPRAARRARRQVKGMIDVAVGFLTAAARGDYDPPGSID